MDLWFCPEAMAECLFSNFDNLTIFEEDKFGEIRPGQHPLLSHEYDVGTDSELTEKQRMALKSNASDLVCLAARNWGKCSYSEDECLLANGEQIKLKNLIGKSKDIIAFDESEYKLVKTKAFFYDNGIKDCKEIVTTGGKQQTVTYNHPVLSDRGWVECKDLKKDDWIAIPRQYPIEGTLEVEDNLAKLIGYLLGDGGCTGGMATFTNINKELIEEFNNLANFFECSLTKNRITYTVRKKKLGIHKKNLIWQIVLNYKLNCLSKCKIIPDEVFTWKNKSIALLLNRLYACDGYIDRSNDTIELTLASKKLIYQVQSLLLRFGIHTYIYPKSINLKGKIFYAWRLKIGTDFKKFIDVIGIKSKDNKLKLKEKSYSTSDRIPKKLFLRFCDLFKGKKHKLRIRNIEQYNFTRKKWQRLSKEIKSNDFIKIAYSNIKWEKIKEITGKGKLPTVAVSVPKYHTYISNNIINHNTCILSKIDVLISLLCIDNYPMIVASFDHVHIRGVLNPIIDALNFHPIISLFRKNIQRSPAYLITTKNGNILDGVNSNAKDGNRAGEQWLQKHSKKTWIEEMSKETQVVYEKRIASQHAVGSVIRLSGMTDVTENTIPGRIYKEAQLKNQSMNAPTFINTDWGVGDLAKETKKYKGEKTLPFRMYVLGELVKDAERAIDMDRVRTSCYPHDKDGFIDEKKTVKFFEISKDRFDIFKNLLIVERPKNAERIWLSSDIGRGVSAKSEIMVFSEVNGIYKYIYNISLYQLIDKEQFQILQYLINKLDANFTGIDAGDGLGVAIFGRLEEVFSRDRLVWYDGSKKIPIGFEKDEKGNIVLEKGKPKYRHLIMAEWSAQHVIELMYSGRFFFPFDYKLDEQLTNVVRMHSGNRVIYDNILEDDHLWDALRVFSIAQWMNEFNLLKPQKNTSSVGYCNWM